MIIYETEIQENRTEYSIFYRALLQKRPVIVRSLLTIPTYVGLLCGIR